MASVRTSIIGRPRRLSRHQRAYPTPRCYTLICEEPLNDRLWHGLLSCDSLAFDTVEGCLPMNYGSSRTR